MPESRGRSEGGQNNLPTGRFNSSRTSRGAHALVRAVHAALVTMIEHVPDVPSYKRVALRNHLAALNRAYRRELQLTDSDVAQIVAEMDDEAFNEVP